MKPKNVVCILSNDQNSIREICRKYLHFDYDEDFSQNKPDPGMLRAFSIGNNVSSSLSDDDLLAISQHKCVNYIVSHQIDKESAVNISSDMLNLVAEAFSHGSLAAKCEASGVAHSREKWLSLRNRLDDRHNVLVTLYEAWVFSPISDSNVVYSVGMHLIGLPDAQVESGENSEYILSIFLYYLVVDQAFKRIKNGHYFKPDSTGSRYLIELKDCERYESDDFFFNPYGIFCLRREIVS